MNALAEMPRVRPTEADAARRAASLDWPGFAEELDAQGCAMIERLLSAEQCRSVAALYPQDERFRSRVIMARHGFGRGENKYFAYPLPELIAGLRTALYPPLAGIATAGTKRSALRRATHPSKTPNSSTGATGPGRPDRRPSCSDTGPATTTACAPRSLRRARLPAAGGLPALRAGEGFTGGEFVLTEQRATDAVARRGRAAAPG